MVYKKIKFKILFYSPLFFFLYSCFDCEKWTDNLEKDECELVVLQRPGIKDQFFNFKGIHPVTGESCDCVSRTSYRWWDLYKDKIEIGDTIIKRKGELIFYIHKKDTTLTFNWECK
ncbi:MAG: hypothetical protein EOO93_11705 [Pedobacter sp.]|nr:MAG: hypothetical protein EOO93_11705 [Pedobacter sp.]